MFFRILAQVTNAWVHAIMIAYVPFTLFRMGLVWFGLGLLMIGAYKLDDMLNYQYFQPKGRHD